MKKEGSLRKATIKNGRPWLKVNYAILLRIREVDNLGWSRAAKEYQKITNQFISRDTLKRRYFEYKELQSTGKLVIDVGPIPLKQNRKT